MVHVSEEIDNDGWLFAKNAIVFEEIYPVSPLLDKTIISGEDTLVESAIEI